jgi:mercuric reductase
MKTAAGRERELAYGEILVVADRRAVTSGLNLAAAGVTTGERGEIVTDEYQRPRTRGSGRVTALVA